MASGQDQDQEILAIATISRVLSALDDVDVRQRVINYMLARFLPAGSPGISPVPTGGLVRSSVAIPTPLLPPSSSEREIPGIARLTEDGGLFVTVRDLKARSRLDAAVRLSYVSIYAFKKMTGEPFSSSKGLTPLLKLWRVYDGNTRTRLARDKGILRSGDTLSLDAHASLDAERFIAEILDSEVQGSWKP